ncbi:MULTISPECIES: hypothetical protein [unclassified Bacillus (in: firmicutes)]|uniref:hypothetical protein n=1 Tax=unclassified Bacillus (in: firmicutes) TaxID=185979 RepID=UPI001F4152CE|nr:hypothetical protein [Bacillus sp. NSP9.1]
MEDIESKIKDKDSDRAIGFSHTSKKSKIEELFKDYQKLSDFCLKAGTLVDDHIDNPFYKELDAFADQMEGLSIHNYKTKNRIGSKETTYVGYGMNKTAVEQDKSDITVDDIFKDSKAFDDVLSEQYKAYKEVNPDVELTYEEYSKAIVSARGFEYESISDVQKGQEFWRDLIVGGGIVVLAIFCAPAAITVGIAYGGAQISSGITGEDWMTKRELNKGERIERTAFGALDMIPAAGAATKSFKTAATVGKLSGRTEPVVQSLKESKSLWANRMRVHTLKAQDKLNDAGFAIKKQFAKSADALNDIARGTEVGAGGTLARKGSNYYGHVNDAHTASKAKMQDSIQRVEREIEGGKGTNGLKNVTKDVPKITKGKYGFNETRQLKGFGHQIDDEIKKHELTLKQFNELKLKPISELTNKEVKIMKDIRDAVPLINKDTLLQKTIPSSDIEKYLSGQYTEIGGYIAKAEDVGHINKYDDVVESFRLDYSFPDGTRPFPEGGSTYGMIRFKTKEVDKISIPYGERMGGTNTDGPPCTQNGFTSARNGEIVPEWQFQGRFEPEKGAELYTVINGEEKLIAIFDKGRFRPIE